MATYPEWERALHEALQGMLAAIEAGSADLVDCIHTVDGLSTGMPSETPPMLRHYLERRSYTKALDFLEGRDESSAANC